MGRRLRRTRRNTVGAREQRQHRGFLAPHATLGARPSGALRLPDHLECGTRAAQVLGEDRRQPFRRQSRRQAARLSAGFRRCRREGRRIAPRPQCVRRQNLERDAHVEQCIAWTSRQLRGRPARCGADRIAVTHHARRSPRHRNMVVSMDLQLNPHRQLNPAAAFEAQVGSGGMPPESPLEMPPQDLLYKPPRRGRHGPGVAVLYARFILATITFGVTIYGVYQMLQVVRFASMTLLQGLMIFFFGISLGWIAFAAGPVLAGAPKGRDPTPAPEPRTSLTALVMPIYNEDPLRTTAALQAMAEALALIDAHRSFEIVILSDSTNADSWIRETLRVDLLRNSLLAIMPVWYRRRWQNIARKSGNLEDFVTRWGGRYDHMIVLDAD